MWGKVVDIGSYLGKVNKYADFEHAPKGSALVAVSMAFKDLETELPNIEFQMKGIRGIPKDEKVILKSELLELIKTLNT